MLDYVGKQLGNYAILRLLGEGGFAQVYLGEHIYLKTTAAIKVLLTNLQKHDLQAFLDEARIIARLRHPQIVRVLEFGIDHDQVPFLVMMYAANGTLRQSHPKGSVVPLERVVAYVKQVAAALQYAHDQRLIHRDVKPENMLIGRNNDVLLSDFGIAVTAHDTLSQQREKVGGTVTYMAPEQLLGKPRPASDQYALGCVVYEWLCGSRLFDATSFIAMAAHHLNTPPQPLTERVPSLPQQIDDVVLRALAKNPSERFPTVSAFAEALEEAYNAAIFHGATYPPTHLALGSSLSPVSLPVDPSAQTIRTKVDPSAPTSLTGLNATTEPRRGGISRRTFATALTGLAGLSAVSGGIIWFALTHTSVPTQHKPTPATPTQSLTLPTLPIGTTLVTYSGHTDNVTGVTWSPDRNWIASSSDDKTVRIWPLPGNTKNQPFIYTGHTDKVLAIAWSPSNAYIASASKDTTVRVWDAPGNGKPGETLTLYQNGSSEIPALAWSPDSKRIASTGDLGAMMQVWDAETGKHTQYYADAVQQGPAPAQGPVNAIAWSPDGLSIVCSIATVSVWNVASGVRLIYTGHQYIVVHGLAWSPNSQYIASAAEDKTVQVWKATTTTPLFTYKGHSAAVYAVAWSPDGKYLASASADTTVQVWEAASGKPVHTYRGHSAPVTAVAWASDSKHIASSGDDKKVLVWQGA